MIKSEHKEKRCRCVGAEACTVRDREKKAQITQYAEQCGAHAKKIACRAKQIKARTQQQKVHHNPSGDDLCDLILADGTQPTEKVHVKILEWR